MVEDLPYAMYVSSIEWLKAHEQELSEMEGALIKLEIQLSSISLARADQIPVRKRQKVVNDFKKRLSVYLTIDIKYVPERLIWRAAGHRTNRQFRYWKTGNVRATGPDKIVFPRLLQMPLERFLVELRKNAPHELTKIQ